MSDPRADLIDAAQCDAEQLLIQKYVENLPKSKFLALWYDPEYGALDYEVAQRRAQVLVEVPEDAEPYAIYEMIHGIWRFNSGTNGINPDAMLEQFLEKAAHAALTRRHPCYGTSS